ncbi:MAG: hypothetical protein LUD16_08235 [Lachnospiraceae bacterium]|nr:hypothetical protein [Lachnospiraceae bacterium]
MSVIEAIFTGQVDPLEQVVTASPKVGEMEKSIDSVMNELEPRIGMKEMDMLTELHDLVLSEAGVIGEEYFRYGLSLGIEQLKESKEVLGYFKIDSLLE